MFSFGAELGMWTGNKKYVEVKKNKEINRLFNVITISKIYFSTSIRACVLWTFFPGIVVPLHVSCYCADILISFILFSPYKQIKDLKAPGVTGFVIIGFSCLATSA